MTEKLLPCPFCGDEAEVTTRDVEPQGDSWYGKNIQTFVICTNCGACLFDDYFHEGFADEHEATTAWNRRADAVPVVRGEWVLQGENEHDYETSLEEKCSLCGRYVYRYDTQPQDNYCPNCGAKMEDEP